MIPRIKNAQQARQNVGIVLSQNSNARGKCPKAT
jgi:hypothetical protein